ncbi:hypothetical protein [Micromonospora thermarum]|uniref:Uncharacterized protein n=1 Tax=Micromonospora thermarum TaxID=2720024 RepID=A0ABX0Z8Z3_9ACTN|nr:hypothetical protein [Micromonospora thermarum]NJP34347.1 hypothetical protein [Micromonospora thermarum]
MTEQRQEWNPDRAPSVPEDAAARATREAQKAHGGSMAPGIVDDTGRPVASDPAGENTPGA